MTLAKFDLLVLGEGVGENDREWFPKWLRRYAMNFRNGLVDNLPVNRNSVISFSKSLLKNGAPAWQRLQAVRALEYYRDGVLLRTEPSLSDIILTLTQLAKRERNVDVDAPPTEEELAKLRGNINRAEPQLIQTMRGELRVLHYSMATERAYVRWVKRYSGHVGSLALEQFDEHDISDFLTTLAVVGNVSPSTQNQAQSALLFVYQCVLGKKLGFLNSVRARKSESIAVWFSVGEIERLLEHFVGEHRLMFLLMYGAGLRHKECRRLRIKDICFDEQHIVVRDGKGAKDRITFLPKQAIPELKRQINGVPHSLRHSFATHLIESGTDIQTVQKLMGHKDVKTTLGYVHVTQKLGVTLMSPIDKLQQDD